jgi:predicted CxxxxCH...CXXCH cytochrome family protein
VNLETHIDGTVEAPTLDCFSCHGDRARAATATNPQLPAAPPFGTSGETAITDRAVGAHQLHLVGGTVSAGFACEECHVVPTDFGTGTGHPSGAVELKAVLGGTGSWNPTDLTCSATYCHGNFTLGNTGNAPTWTSPAVNACGTCHGLPPGGTHPQNTECERCHPGYTGTSVNLATHVNGQLDAELNCTSCHGDASRTSALPTCPTSSPLCVDPNLKVAPPVTATGGSAGAHLAHVSPAVLRSRPAQCEECHSGKIPTPSTSHPSAAIDVAFGGRAVTGGAAPAYDAATGCSATYCHGNYSGVYHYEMWDYSNDVPIPKTWNYAGKNATPRWGDAPATCGSCHGDPPGGIWHSTGHGSQPEHRTCQLCHPDATGTAAGGGASITDAAKHVNGVIDLAPRFTTVCRSCH